MNQFSNSWKSNKAYFDDLSFFASLSGLFADSAIPYLDYRLAENVFCNSFHAINDARSCTAYDARIQKLGIGIKTFTLKNNASVEKVAEFNKLKSKLDPLHGIDLARTLAEFRNDRIHFADANFGVDERMYHIVGRGEGFLRLFNTGYDFIDAEHIRVTLDDGRSFFFTDGIHEYSFNRSKTVLFKRFLVADDHKDVPVEILQNPLELLRELLALKSGAGISTATSTPSFVVLPSSQQVLSKGSDYIILPLYSTRSRTRYIPEKSGLNQWNAGGRKRDPNEVYIPIPIQIHHDYPNFFPPRDKHFALSLPDGTVLSAKVCQENCKALMSTRNKDLGAWILRKILKKPEGEIVTIDDLDRYGIDSVRVVNNHSIDEEGRNCYSISFTTSDYESYSDFNDVNSSEL